KFKNKTVYVENSQRPNTAIEHDHDIQVEANIFHWFTKEYGSVTILPDNLLETHLDLFDKCRMAVLCYHCEYITEGGHRVIRKILTRGTSLISMGANQLYWLVRWNHDRTQLECHKDGTRFRSSFLYGGLWKHHFRPPRKY